MDTNVRQEDIDALQPGGWLTDTCIEFYYELVERVFPQHCFLRPGMSHVVLNAHYALDGVLPEDVTRKERIFIPVNDQRRNEAGGTHWSLLIVDVAQNRVWYYDSLGYPCPMRLQRTWQRRAESFGVTCHHIEQLNGPKQPNTCDCGVYLLLATACAARGEEVQFTEEQAAEQRRILQEYMIKELQQ